MAASDRVRGDNLYISFDGVEVDADYQTFEVGNTADTIDSSAGSQASKTYIVGLKDGTASLTYAYTGSAGTAVTVKFKVGTSGTLLWGPEGTATGKPKGGVVALVTGHSRPHQYDGLVTRTVNFQFSGDMLFDDEDDAW